MELIIDGEKHFIDNTNDIIRLILYKDSGEFLQHMMVGLSKGNLIRKKINYINDSTELLTYLAYNADKIDKKIKRLSEQEKLPNPAKLTQDSNNSKQDITLTTPTPIGKIYSFSAIKPIIKTFELNSTPINVIRNSPTNKKTIKGSSNNNRFFITPPNIKAYYPPTTHCNYDYKTYYYFLNLITNQHDYICILFPSAKLTDYQQLFEAQLEKILWKSKNHDNPVFFIAAEPGNSEQYFCGVVLKNQLLIINPSDLTGNISVFKTLANLQRGSVDLKIFISNSKISNKAFEAKYNSDGPIIIEIAMSFILSVDKDELLEFFQEQIKNNQPIKHEEANLSYYDSSTKKILLLRTLKQLSAINSKRNLKYKEKYNNIINKIRKQQAILLRCWSEARAKEQKKPEYYYLHKLEKAAELTHNPPQSINNLNKLKT